MKLPDDKNIIVTSDWHLRSSSISCRDSSTLIEDQMNVVGQIFDIAREHNAVVLCVGDLFHSPNESKAIEIPIIKKIRSIDVPFYFIPGNHDLRYHTQVENTSYSLFVESTKTNPNVHEVLYEVLEHGVFSNILRWRMFKIGLAHTLLCKYETEAKRMNGLSAKEYLDYCSGIDFIFSGDNHKMFSVGKHKDFVLNPGCIWKQKVNEEEYKPGVFLVSEKGNGFKSILLQDPSLLYTDNLEKRKDRNDRIDEFISRVKSNKKVTLSFLDNVEERKRKLNKRAQNIVDDVLQESGA